MSEDFCTTCPTPTSTGGNATNSERTTLATKRYGALSPRQTIALIQQGKWWPFDRVDGKLLVKLHKQHENATTEELEEAPW